MEKETIQLDFEKMGGLVPAVVQDDVTKKVLMVGFMNEAAFHKTLDTNRVTFFSRTKGRLWTKGEQSGNFLEVKSILPDCDNDTLLINLRDRYLTVYRYFQFHVFSHVKLWQHGVEY